MASSLPKENDNEEGEILTFDALVGAVALSHEAVQARVRELALEGDGDQGPLAAALCKELVKHRGSVAEEEMCAPWTPNSSVGSAVLLLLTRLEEWRKTGVVPKELSTGKSFGTIIAGVVEMGPDVYTDLHWQKEVLQSYRSLLIGVNKCLQALETKEAENHAMTQLVDDLLHRLGRKGVLALLGHRCTTGTRDLLAPNIPELIHSFNVEHKHGLTVGARAFSKHCHRNPSFWPECRGSVQTRNKVAVDELIKILKDPAWVNVHVVPKGSGDGSQLTTIEIRGPHLWGARWFYDTDNHHPFRGFLEPVSPYYNGSGE